MRLNRLAVPHLQDRSFDLRYERLPYFTNPWHFHPELELNFVVAGTGTRFIGQRVERFSSGEIILLGKNLPHYWKNDAAYYQPDRQLLAEAIVVRFAEDFVGSSFFNLPETKAVSELFKRAADGLRLLEPLCKQVAEQLYALLDLEGFTQLLALLAILQKIADSDAVESISPGYVPGQLVSNQNKRLSNVMAYVMEHFTQPISLGQVAERASMNEAAFCRYFKTQTGQTLTQFITDLRIRYACELLTSSEASVSQICYQVGLDNVSHFIQAFKKHQKMTPLAFRRQGL